MARPNQSSKGLSLTIPEDVYRMLIREAAREQRSLSNMATILIREALTTRKGGKEE
jgi:predicted CopG family antitoxin